MSDLLNVEIRANSLPAENAILKAQVGLLKWEIRGLTQERGRLLRVRGLAVALLAAMEHDTATGVCDWTDVEHTAVSALRAELDR